MGVTDNIKDKARKATNSVVDKAEQVFGSPKSAKELSARIIEHLSNEEYKEVVHVLIDEAKKHIDKIEVAGDKDLIRKQLKDFEKVVNDIAEDFEDKDYNNIIASLKELEKNIPEDVTKIYTPFKWAKKILSSIIDVLKKSKKDDEALDFKELGKIIESFFSESKDK